MHLNSAIVIYSTKKEALKPLFLVTRLGLEPKTPTLKV